MNQIEMKHVGYQYNKTGEQALIDIDLTIRSGEFVGIVGSNGSGKSTLARLLNVLLEPTEGQVLIGGLDTHKRENVQQIRQKVGMVFQNPDNQLVATKVEDDVAFGLENLGVPSSQIRRRVDRALEQVDMQDYRDFSPHQLSGGQKQRVALAGILAMEPSCIVLDEPTAMLDPRGRKEVMSVVQDLNQQKNITVVYITHVMREASRTDRIIVMSEGKIVRRGQPAPIFADIDFMNKIGLSVPPVTELAVALRKKGLNLPDIMDVDELVKCIC